MRKLLNHKHASVAMVGGAIGLLITLIISVLIFYSMLASSPSLPAPAAGASSYYKALQNQSENASSTISSQASTFFTIAPIVAIVIVAVVVIGYVQRIGG